MSRIVSSGRRRFLRSLAAAGGGLFLSAGVRRSRAGEGKGRLSAGGTPSVEPTGGQASVGPESGRGLVALARGEGVGADPDKAVEGTLIGRWLGEMLPPITGAGSAAEAWKRLFRPEDVVGIKLNCLAGPRLSPRPALVDALVKGVTTAGVPPEQIIVWERSGRELQRAGFALNAGGRGPRVYGTDALEQGYESMPSMSGSIGSCFSLILTRKCTALINVGVLKDHDLAGVSVGMKNLYGVIHNPNKYHDNACDPYVADLANHPDIRNRLRLTICDGLTAQCHGGPAHVGRWTWNYGGILAGCDPVALDRVGARVIEERRRGKGLPSLTEAGRSPEYINTAGRLGLGESRFERIRIHKVG